MRIFLFRGFPVVVVAGENLRLRCGEYSFSTFFRNFDFIWRLDLPFIDGFVDEELLDEGESERSSSLDFEWLKKKWNDYLHHAKLQQYHISGILEVHPRLPR
jgi:hypothetical protein